MPIAAPAHKRNDNHCNVPPQDYVPFLPTPMRVVHRMLQMAEIQDGETIYDLGCGDGRMVIAAVKKYGARGVGIDVDRARLDLARRRAGPDVARITFRRQNVFKVDLRPADVVTMFLNPGVNFKLIPRFNRLRPGTRIVSHNCEIPGIVSCKTTRLMCRDGYSHEIFLYRVPLLPIGSCG